MAWRSSASTNDEMVDNLKSFQVITTNIVEQGFRNVDRSYFVPPGREHLAHADQPLKFGNIHISAPHVYGSAIEALELRPNAPLAFLNIGSGTGYVSCVVASILGYTSTNYGIEIQNDAVLHSRDAIDRWKQAYSGKLPQIQIVHGNALNILLDKGEATVGFDRIYIGAAINRTDLNKVTCMLKPGGIMVGPVGDELVKIIRTTIRNSNTSTTTTTTTTQFSEQVVSGVRFIPLLPNPPIETLLPSNVWEPSVHNTYPDSFRVASKILLLCNNASYKQPLPSDIAPEERLNFAAMLPATIWIEILSFTHRDWFERKQPDKQFLRKRLSEEQANARQARQATEDVQARLQIVERERDVYKLLAMRWQKRLRLLTQLDQRNTHMQEFNDGHKDIRGQEDTAFSYFESMLESYHRYQGDNSNGVEEDEHQQALVPSTTAGRNEERGSESDHFYGFSDDDEAIDPHPEPETKYSSDLI
eukprot:CAMPEP_0202442050 /NCGR_PEP_ID=MMETSP1360-20130828/1538_1 /ASSEMBLY_ACC=CAM_ASM_000848 /TAXON_ID=515479 /ORGANISM="Licmophora paradoxa, Strain CCMP2313" /LENGTH=473 /DNA_ID=CAMNT_0049057293 /DNA_START=98 /DNA_END=1519 /DNA_ORIENTATION=-